MNRRNIFKIFFLPKGVSSTYANIILLDRELSQRNVEFFNFLSVYLLRVIHRSGRISLKTKLDGGI